MEKLIRINGKEYIIPNEIFDKKIKQKHRKKNKWCNLYFFKNRKKNVITDKNQVKDDLVITSALQYQRDTFYKMSSISQEDDTFDYYYKLKYNTSTDIVKHKSRCKKSLKKTKHKWQDYKKPLSEYEMSADGRFVVRFD
tara:strand:- start:329 stop:745 length:417 start_codon:yes stop_codon:yes gene_type:complete